MSDIVISSSKKAILDAAITGAVSTSEAVPAEIVKIEAVAEPQAVVSHTWKSGEVITAVLLNQLEDNAANALELAQTNETNLGEIHGTVEAIIVDGNTPKVNGATIADATVAVEALKGGITADKLSLGNGVRMNPTTKMLEVPVDSAVLVYGTNGIGIKDDSLTPALFAGYDAGTGHSKYIRVKSDGSGFDFVDAPTVDNLGGATAIGKAVMKATDAASARNAIGAGTSSFSGNYNDLTNKPVIGSAGYTKQTATIPSTLSALKVSHLRTESDGTLVEGVFDITNSSAATVSIAANTVFATGLTMKAEAATYSCLVWGSGDPLTLSANDTGKSLSFTTDVSVPANSTLHVYVRDNEG